MCFSAEASFSAAILLTIAGYFTTKVATDKQQKLLAAIPFLFAMQQFVEGFVWLSSNHAAVLIYLFIALFVWPIWIPLSFFFAERKMIFGCLLGLGILYNILLITQLFSHDPSAQFPIRVNNNSIHYILPQIPMLTIWQYPTILIYTMTTILPFFLSSIARMWILGLILTIGFAIASYFYLITFTSVWCFFAACASIGLYYVLRYQRRIGDVKNCV